MNNKKINTFLPILLLLLLQGELYVPLPILGIKFCVEIFYGRFIDIKEYIII